MPIALTIDKAVAESNLSRSEIYRRMATGELPSIKIGKRRLIRTADLEAFLAANAVAQ